MSKWAIAIAGGALALGVAGCSSEEPPRTAGHGNVFAFKLAAIEDYKVGQMVTLPEDALVQSVRIWVDGAGPEAGAAQAVRGLLYSDDGGGGPQELIAQTTEANVADEREAGFLDLEFEAPVSVPAGPVHAAVHFGGADRSSRYTRSGSGRNRGSWYTFGFDDAYADGPDAVVPSGEVNSVDRRISLNLAFQAES